MLDAILLVCLLVVMPLRANWLAWRKPSGIDRMARYLKTISVALVLLSLLAVDWIGAGRSADGLGLAIPVPPRGVVGLVFAAVVLVGLAVAMWLSDGQGKKAAPAADVALLPTTRSELVLFLALSVVIGAAWEVLYRGFLLWELTPKIGAPATVALASAAYAAAHGFKSLRKLLASLVAALVFTTAYAFTRNLWWLMVIHAGLPVLAAASQMRRLSAPAAPELARPIA